MFAAVAPAPVCFLTQAIFPVSPRVCVEPFHLKSPPLFPPRYLLLSVLRL
jgi:hypothetical protein